MRVSWEKSLNPILRLGTIFDRGFLRIRENITFPRPERTITSFGNIELGDIKARLYYNGTREQLKYCNELIFHGMSSCFSDLMHILVPGGGFVTMSPECHDDYVSGWARNTHKPILSINYGKSPEHPYPYALEEVYDAYRAIVSSNGAVIGMSGWKFPGNSLDKKPIRIVAAGDSAYLSPDLIS